MMHFSSAVKRAMADFFTFFHARFMETPRIFFMTGIAIGEMLCVAGGWPYGWVRLLHMLLSYNDTH